MTVEELARAIAVANLRTHGVDCGGDHPSGHPWHTPPEEPTP